MNDISKDFEAELSALIEKHGVARIRQADVLGQYLGRNGCVGVDAQWVLGGMMAAYAHKNDVLGNLKALVEGLVASRGTDRFKYNDLDCDMWAQTVTRQQPCLTCSSLVANITADEYPIPTQCPRCGGAKIDPELQEKGWFLVWDNHGNGSAFVLWESFVGNPEMHIRELPYNLGDEHRFTVLKELAQEVPKGIYETEMALIRYRDGRDKGSHSWRRC